MDKKRVLFDVAANVGDKLKEAKQLFDQGARQDDARLKRLATEIRAGDALLHQLYKDWYGRNPSTDEILDELLKEIE